MATADGFEPYALGLTALQAKTAIENAHSNLNAAGIKALYESNANTEVFTTTEKSNLAGVSSNIQTQLNSKAPLASPALTGIPTIDGKNILTVQNVASGNIRVGNIHIGDGSFSSLSVLNLNSISSSPSWSRVGATLSPTANIIWTALDVVPDKARAIIAVIDSSINNTSGADSELSFYAMSADVTPGGVNLPNNAYNRISRVVATNNTRDASYHQVIIPVDTINNREFYISRDLIGTGVNSSSLYLRGFITDI